METHKPSAKDVDSIEALFRETFAASESVDEGVVVGALSREILSTTPPGDVYSFCDFAGDALIGCILFTRLSFEKSDRSVFLMAPVAIRPEQQRKSIGQRLITEGLYALRKRGIDTVMTYGDPAYYSKTGFTAVDETVIPAPLPLSHPHGWLGQSLTGSSIETMHGPSQCVPAFRKEELW